MVQDEHEDRKMGRARCLYGQASSEKRLNKLQQRFRYRNLLCHISVVRRRQFYDDKLVEKAAIVRREGGK